MRQNGVNMLWLWPRPWVSLTREGRVDVGLQDPSLPEVALGLGLVESYERLLALKAAL